MTHKTNTPAPAMQEAVSDADLLRICQKFNPGQDFDLAKAVRAEVLSKLRAPVADERAAFETFQRGTGLNELYLEHHPESGQYMWTATKEAWEAWQARAALASAPVAGDAAYIAQLRAALILARDSHGVSLLTDPPQDAWKARHVDEVIRAALAAGQGEAAGGGTC